MSRVADVFSAKLIAAFAAVLLLVGGTGLLALWQHDSISAAGEADARAAFEDLILAERLRADVERRIASGRGLLLARDEISNARSQTAKADVERGIRDLRARTQTAEGGRLLARLARAVEGSDAALERVLATETERSTQEQIGGRFENELRPKRAELDRAIDAYLEYRNERLVASLAATRRSGERALEIALAFVTVSVLAGAAFSLWSGRRLKGMFAREQRAVHAAEAAVQAREELLAVVAHDLRSPLASIVLKASSLERIGDIEKIRKKTADIVSIGLRMEYLIRTLLDAATLEAGRLSVNRTECSVDDLLDETIRMFAPLATSHSIELERRGAEQPATVLADRERVLQVLSNLVGNAIKFTPEGGRIELWFEREGEGLRVSVRDTGSGISREHLPHVFERYWQKDGVRKRGTGLGLYIAREIVQAHDGRIWVESELGHGAAFHFTLPAAQMTDFSPSVR